jgi:hypothetical protein
MLASVIQNKLEERYESSREKTPEIKDRLAVLIA